MAMNATTEMATMYQAGAMALPRRLDEGDGDERRRAAEDGVGEVEGQREAGVAHLSGERLGQVARERAVVDGEQKAHEQLDDQNDPEVHRAEQHECRHREHDEAHTAPMSIFLRPTLSEMRPDRKMKAM